MVDGPPMERDMLRAVVATLIEFSALAMFILAIFVIAGVVTGAF